MLIVPLVATIVYYLLLLFFFLLLARLVLDLVQAFNHSWRPQHMGLVLAEFAYSVTDPPVRFFRRLIPPLRLGPLALDFGWTITMLACMVGMYIAVGFQG